MVETDDHPFSPINADQQSNNLENKAMTNSLDVLQGTLDLLILRTLAWEPMHGYAVSRWIRERTRGALGIEDAALYQALHRMERNGWIEAEWGVSENNRKAKYYEVTALGRKQLRSEISAWRRYVDAVFLVLEPAREG
jgi:PadR family transcriptional regulator, regulatory protein PadR